MDEDDEEMDIDDDDDDEAGPSTPTTSNSMSVLSYAVLNYSIIFAFIMFNHPFSTSSAIQQVALFKPPAGGDKWCPGSIISTVRLMTCPFTICT